ncbi:murein biosynthesis integral membrane protein MurJ [Aerococcaceae bacterium WGS1372]
MKKTAVQVMIITLISKFFGFARDIVLSYFYGATNVSDAYLISLTIPDVISSFIITGIATAFIPMYNRILQAEGEEQVNGFTNNLVNTLTAASGILYLVSFIFTPQFVRVFASGFNEETVNIAIQLTRISVISVFFTGLIALSTAYLQIKDNFIIPALIGFPLNVTIIASIYLSTQTSYIVLAIGFVIATASQLLIMIPGIYKTGFRYRLTIDLQDSDLRRMIKIAIPVIIGSSINQINVLINRTVASNVTVGGISALNYAYMITFFIHGLFVVSIISIVYPSISRRATEGDFEGMKIETTNVIKSLSMIIIPASFGAVIFSREIVSLLYGRGNFQEDAIAMTSSALAYFAVGMIFVAIREILSRAFYAMQDTRTPMINATIGVIVNIILTPIFSQIFGIGGLALATSVSALVTVVLLTINLRKKSGSFGIVSISTLFIKLIIGSAIMSLVAYTSYYLLINGIHETIALFIAILIGVASYAIAIMMMNIKEINDTLASVKDFIVNRRHRDH